MCLGKGKGEKKGSLEVGSLEVGRFEVLKCEVWRYEVRSKKKVKNSK